MIPEDVKAHWEACAREHGGDVKATTPGATAKMLEIDALWRHLMGMPAGTRVLEAGCGNGINLIELNKRLPTFDFDGFDYVSEMIESAKASDTAGDINFFEGDILKMDAIPLWGYMDGDKVRLSVYDAVITDRCLINLDTWGKQKQAIKALADRVRPGGKLLLIENVIQGRKAQNRLRAHLGLPERQLMPPFNLFFDENELVQYLWDIGMRDIETEDFSSLHDLMLYVLLPALRHALLRAPRKWDAWEYNHPLVKIAAKLAIKDSLMMPDVFGRFGQNVLFTCRKPT